MSATFQKAARLDAELRARADEIGQQIYRDEMMREIEEE